MDDAHIRELADAIVALHAFVERGLARVTARLDAFAARLDAVERAQLADESRRLEADRAARALERRAASPRAALKAKRS